MVVRVDSLPRGRGSVAPRELVFGLFILPAFFPEGGYRWLSKGDRVAVGFGVFVNGTPLPGLSIKYRPLQVLWHIKVFFLKVVVDLIVAFKFDAVDIPARRDRAAVTFISPFPSFRSPPLD